MKFWQWLTGFFVGREEPAPVEPRVVELYTKRTHQSRTFFVSVPGNSYDAMLALTEKTGIRKYSAWVEMDGRLDVMLRAVSVTVKALNPDWLVTVEYARPQYAEPDPSPPGEPLTTDALRQLCAGAGTDGAVQFTSEGGFHLTPPAASN